MLPISFIKCFLLVLLFASCVLISYGKGGRGGGGSRGGGRSSGGGWGRSSSSRSSSSSSSSSSGKSSSSYDTSSSLGSGSSFSFKQPSSSSVKDHASLSGGAARGIQSANYPRQQYSQKPSAPSATSLFQSVPNANYPRQPISPNSFTSSHSSFPQVGIANANYPRQPISYNRFMSSQSLSSQGIIPNANYPRLTPKTFGSSQPQDFPTVNFPRQPISPNSFTSSHSSFPQVGIPNANYPRQPISYNRFMSSQSLSSQGIIPNANYPRLTPKTFGSSQPQDFPTVNFPRQAITPNLAIPRERSTIQVQPSRTSSFYNRPPSGLPNANYPMQPHIPPQILGSGVWNPKSGMSAPVYMNYGGLPTGANMYTKPLKKKGFIGSLISLGNSGKPYKNKYYGSYPSPYGMGGGRPSDVLGNFMGNKGSKKAMYTILPYMAARKSPKIFKPKFRFYSYWPVHYHSHGYHSHLYDTEYTNDYIGRCNRPIKPDHAKIVCNSTHNQVDCGVTCEEGYRYPDNTTTKSNRCWHATGVWNPTKNFPACEPVCNETCLNGGKCESPGECGCTSEYRGPHCEFHFLNCDISKFTKRLEIRWMCIHTKNETFCRVKCKSPEHFTTPSHSLYKCTPEGVWTPSSMPLCGTPNTEANSIVGETRENSTTVPQEKVTKATERKVSGVS